MKIDGFSRYSLNDSPALLYEMTLREGSGRLAHGGSLVCETGKYTGRSPNDRFVLDDPKISDSIWWSNANRPIDKERFEALHCRVRDYLGKHHTYIQHLYAGTDPTYRLNIRVISESPWHALFAQNMFIRPTNNTTENFAPDVTILHAPYLQTNPAEDGTNSECCILVDFVRKLVIICGTRYAGEIKKSVFSILNYWLPMQGVLPMHCSANIGKNGDVAIFFGLSGTGKTTLSADGSRALIGDDEHGWSATGTFNFEGGCYAKAIDLSPSAEPEIYATTKRFGTILENVVMNPVTRRIDFTDRSLAENTRVSYPIDYIPNIEPSGMGGVPKNIVMLTADAFGVLPPISELTTDQAMYHFLSGYTARVAGTERGVTEPQATFSSCFGAPFMPRHPAVYAKILGERIASTKARCWLVNTGWQGGSYGTGTRISISHTRAMLNAALEGKLADVVRVKDANFGLLVPEKCPDVPSDILQPRQSWENTESYDDTAHKLCRLFQDNFKQFKTSVTENVCRAGIYAT